MSKSRKLVSNPPAELQLPGYDQVLGNVVELLGVGTQGGSQVGQRPHHGHVLGNRQAYWSSSSREDRTGPGTVQADRTALGGSHPEVRSWLQLRQSHPDEAILSGLAVWADSSDTV